MFSHILVAVDGSEQSKKALNHALELARKFDSKITLIHVYSTAVPMVPAVDAFTTPTVTAPVSMEVAARMAEEAKQRGKQILDEAEKSAEEFGISVEKVLKEGDVVKETVSLAEQERFDLIVLGHRGWSKIRELLLGAVSEGISHKAPCPVLIVK